MPTMRLLFLKFFMIQLVARSSELEGQPFRLVWAQDQLDARDVYAAAKQSALMKYDSTVGKEEMLRADVGSYGNPMLSPDGDWVVFSDRVQNKVFKIRFEGGEIEEVATGFAAELWRDPTTGIDMVFVANDPEGYIGLPAWGRIERKPLHGKEALEPFWDATETMANNFQLSADGKVASGQFPWPIGGVAVIESQRWFPLNRGCWPSLAPDNSYLCWQFDGAHKNVVMQDPLTREEWVVNLNTLPNFGNFEVYHPRWSNHPRFMVFTGPYVEGRGGNRIIGGGKAVEVYVGTFAEDFKSLSSVRKITKNQKGDFFPDLWVQGGEKAVSGLPQRTEFKASSDADYSLYFRWETDNADNRGPDGKSLKRLELFDKATIGPNHELVLRGRGGHANPKGDHFTWRETVGRTQAWTFESVFTPSLTRQRGRMYGYTRRNGQTNIAIDQVENGVLLSMNVGDQSSLWLGSVKKGEPFHLIISVKGTRFRAWVNGLLIEKTLPGSPAWATGSMIFGEQQGYGYPWEGSVSHIRLITRELQADEVEERIKKVRAQLATFKQPARVTVRARLLEASATSTVKSIAPYKNELSACAFERVEVLEGDFEHERFAAYVFGILNGIPNTDRPHQIGKIYTLELEPFGEQPQLRSQLKSNDLDDLDLPEFLLLP